MIRLTKIRLKDIDRVLPDRAELDKLRTILENNFHTKDILFEYEDDGKEVKDGKGDRE